MKKIKMNKVYKFQKYIDYEFKNPDLLFQALTTPQYGNENNVPHYEILETLGDVVIKLIFSLKLYNSGEQDPGELTKTKQCLENNQTFLKVAKDMKLENYIYSSKSQKIKGTSILADIFEAICGAIYIDSDNNIQIVEKQIIDRFIQDWDSFLKESMSLSKNELLEFLQKLYKMTPIVKYDYEQIGPQHELLWIVKSARILDQNNIDIVTLPISLKSEPFKTKKDAEKDISIKILRYLKRIN